MQFILRGLSVGVVSLAITAGAWAIPVEVNLSIFDQDRNGQFGRGSQWVNNAVGGTLLWQEGNGLTPFNGDIIANQGNPNLHRGNDVRFRVVQNGGLNIGFMRFDLNSAEEARRVFGPVTEATFQSGTHLNSDPGTPEVPRQDFISEGVVVRINVYGLLPGHAQQAWVTTAINSTNSGEGWAATPPDPLTWNNAPALDRDNFGVLAAETFGGAALLGHFDISTATLGTLPSFSSAELAAFLNDARLNGDHLASFIMVPEVIAGTLSSVDNVNLQGATGGGGRGNKANLTMTVVPEPASLGLVGFGAVMFLRRRRSGF